MNYFDKNENKRLKNFDSLVIVLENIFLFKKKTKKHV